MTDTAARPAAPPEVPAQAPQALQFLQRQLTGRVVRDLDRPFAPGTVAPHPVAAALYEVLGPYATSHAEQFWGATYRALLDHALNAGWLLAAPAQVHAPRFAPLLAVVLADLLPSEETALSRWVERTGTSLPPTVLEAAATDLRAFQHVAFADLPALLSVNPLPAVDLAALPHPGSAHTTMLVRLVTAPDWGALAPDLVSYFAEHGAGLFARHRAFRWTVSPGSPGSDEGHFAPVAAPDPIAHAHLVGYEAERALLRRTTVQFLAGYPGNNVLLYGDRGTGKSSSVKALLNEQPAPGEAPDLWERLRIVEVPKARLADFPLLAARLRSKPQRFIVFVDDLSFEEGETQYKEMKAMLEGGLEVRPANVVVYATSNRRHLIREQFADRAAPGSQEVHAWDTVQEKLSFADRFGVMITFPTPDQAAYLAIVEGLARQRGLLATPEGAPQASGPARTDGATGAASATGAAGQAQIERGALRARAIEWAAWHNGRSGRTARQFVDYLEGELGTQGEERRA